MGHAGTSAHQLDLPGFEFSTVAHAVLVGECAGDDIAENLHVPVRMGRKTAAGGDLVLVDHAQAAKTHVGRIVIIREAETVFAFQPAMFQDEIGIMPVLSHPGLVKGKIRIIAVAAARVKAVLCCGIAYRPAGKFLARRRILFFIIADLESAVAGVIATIFICFDFTAIGTSLGSVFTTAVVAHFAETLSQMVHADLHHLSLPQTRSSRSHRITAGIDGKTGKCSTAADQWR